MTTGSEPNSVTGPALMGLSDYLGRQPVAVQGIGSPRHEHYWAFTDPLGSVAPERLLATCHCGVAKWVTVAEA